METGLKLLMRDGAVRVAFHPRLSGQHYAEFMEFVERSTTKRELQIAAEESARRWGLGLEFEDLSV